MSAQAVMIGIIILLVLLVLYLTQIRECITLSNPEQRKCVQEGNLWIDNHCRDKSKMIFLDEEDEDAVSAFKCATHGVWTWTSPTPNDPNDFKSCFRHNDTSVHVGAVPISIS